MARLTLVSALNMHSMLHARKASNSSSIPLLQQEHNQSQQRKRAKHLLSQCMAAEVVDSLEHSMTECTCIQLLAALLIITPAWAWERTPKSQPVAELWRLSMASDRDLDMDSPWPFSPLCGTLFQDMEKPAGLALCACPPAWPCKVALKWSSMRQHAASSGCLSHNGCHSYAKVYSTPVSFNIIITLVALQILAAVQACVEDVHML